MRDLKHWGLAPLSILVAALFCASGCTAAAQDHLLRTYFDTCAIADRTALSNMAIVAFDPARDGVVGHFHVTRRSPIRLEPVTGARSFDDPTAARIVSLSLLDPLRPRDPSGAQLAVQTLDVEADVYRENRSEQQVLNVMLARAETPRDTGRWIVVRLVRGARISPAASSARPTRTAP
ncbi:MAG: hypothetical protein ACM36C_13825 [Acidobacteriota bacterium]